MKKFFLIICAAVIFLSGCGNTQPPVEVRAEKILSVDGALTLTHEGKISASDELEIFSPISGRIIEKYFSDGDDVAEGQLLFKIGAPEDNAEFLKDKAALAESMTALAREINELQQAETLLKTNSISAQEVADKKFALEERQDQIAELKERVKNLEESSVQGLIHAPKSGRLGAVDAPLGMQVTANETLIATVGNINPVVVRVEISAEEYKILTAADDLEISLAFSDGTIYPYSGTIKIFSDFAEVYFENPDDLMILGTSAQIKIDGAKISKSLLIPENAIWHGEGDAGDFVYVVDKDKTLAIKKIQLGDKLGKNFLVKDGLTANDLIIVDDVTNLREGTPLSVSNK